MSYELLSSENDKDPEMKNLYSVVGTRTDIFGNSSASYGSGMSKNMAEASHIHGDLYNIGDSSSGSGVATVASEYIPPYVPLKNPPPLLGNPRGVEVKYEDFDMLGSTPLYSAGGDYNSYILIVIIIISLLAASFWIQGGNELITKYFYGGGKISTKDIFIWAVLLTLLMVVISKISGIPFILSSNL